MKLLAMIGAVSLLMAAPGMSGATVDDAQIAAIVVTANQVDIDAGRLAAAKSANVEVRKFAELMVSDHTSVNKAATDLVTRLGVVPADNATAQSLKAGGEKNRAALTKLEGEAFDRAYVEHEVAYHRQVIDALDGVLIPGATSHELKALLVKVRPAFVAHLEHAEHLLSSLGKAH
jgi:putative membrane protein